MFTIREAKLADVRGIRDVFQAEYGDHYAYPQYYDTETLSRLVYASGTVLLVGVDQDSGRIAGTASVVFSVAAQNDLLGEFGRLVVHPDFRGRGLGTQLMQARIDYVAPRLHVGIVENRTKHAYSQRISERFGFVPVGFIPGKLLVRDRETIAQYVRYFGDALSLRRNNPRIIPEASRLAHLALENCGLPQDAIVDDTAVSYPPEGDFDLGELTTEGYTSLLRIERGRLQHRDVFGPIRLHYGLFQIQSRHSNYLIARRGNQITGGIGYLIDEVEKAAKIFELISVNDEPIRILVEAFLQKCQTELDVEYAEVDVSAYSPRTQRTLLELGFLPVSYVPAHVFHQVERLDAVKMARLMAPADFTTLDYCESVRPVADAVIQAFTTKDAFPRIADASQSTPLFQGLVKEQRERLLSVCSPATYPPGATIYCSGSSDGMMHLILSGKVDLISPTGQQIAQLGAGQCFGETSLLEDSSIEPPHTLDAIAATDVETAAFPKGPFHELIRRRPDIGLVVYRNLAVDLSTKLRGSHPR